MADKKISQLNSATTLDGTELVPVVQTGNTVKTTIQDIVDLVPTPTSPNLQDVTDSGNTTTNAIDTAGITTDYVQLDTTAVNTNAVGKIIWNDTDGTANLGLKGGNVVLQIGQEHVVRVVNKSSVNLLESNYQAVKITGATGQRLSIDLAQADNDANSASTLAIVTEDIAKNQEGFCTVLGQIHDINTTGSLQGETWNDGDILYLSGTTAGAITNVKPSAPIHTIILGYVEYAHAIHGKIYVKIDNGYELEELHNVQDVSYSTPVDADSLLIKDNSTSLWKRLTIANLKTFLTGLYVSLTGNQTIAGIKTFSDNILFNNGTVKASLQPVPTVPSYMGMFLNVTPNSSNYAITNDGSGNTFVNGTANVYVSANATNVSRWGSLFQLHTPVAASSGSLIKWQLTIPADTGLTASTNIPNFKITGNTKQFATGSLATQYFNYFTANTLAFVGASTATDVFNLFVEKPIAGTNATITNNFAIGTNGSIKVGENLNLAGISSASKSQVLHYDTTTKNVSYFTFSGTMFKDTTNSSDLTGTTEQIVKSILIPANTFTTGDIIFVEVRNRKTSSAGSTDHYIKVNTSNSLTSATQIGLLTTTATGFLAGFSRMLCIKSSTVTETAASTTSFTTDLGQPTAASDLNIDWTVNQYLIISCKNLIGTDTFRNSYLTISKK